MRIIAETGERVLVVVPSRLASNAFIVIVDDNGNPLVEAMIQDGLIEKVTERVCRRDGSDNTGRP